MGTLLEIKIDENWGTALINIWNAGVELGKDPKIREFVKENDKEIINFLMNEKTKPLRLFLIAFLMGIMSANKTEVDSNSR